MCKKFRLHPYLDDKFTSCHSQEKGGGNQLYFGVDSGFYYLPVDILKYIPFSLVGYNLV